MSTPMLIRKALLSLWGIRILLLAFCPVLADGPADNQSHQVRPIPPEGTPGSALRGDRANLMALIVRWSVCQDRAKGKQEDADPPKGQQGLANQHGC